VAKPEEVLELVAIREKLERSHQAQHVILSHSIHISAALRSPATYFLAYTQHMLGVSWELPKTAFD